MRMTQVARVALTGTVLGALSTTSLAAVTLTSAPVAPVPTPTFDAAPGSGAPAAPVAQAPTHPVDGAAIAATALGPALRAAEDIPIVRTAAPAVVPRALPVVLPTVVPEVAPVVVAPPDVPQVRLPRGVRAQVLQACAMDLLDDELCGWVQGRSSSR